MLGIDLAFLLQWHTHLSLWGLCGGLLWQGYTINQTQRVFYLLVRNPHVHQRQSSWHFKSKNTIWLWGLREEKRMDRRWHGEVNVCPAVFQSIILRRTLREGEFTESQFSDHLHLSYISRKPLSMNLKKNRVSLCTPSQPGTCCADQTSLSSQTLWLLGAMRGVH